ncbi:zincin-like metallopeptidase domain-containing protein [Coprobacillaceae bacterium CR2/5/TPMF4]|nr:zincin-like metallopeptidase domain-containing protein [Coprobacillaceae bacterium CR2/5/TPMF4]
MNDQDRQEFKEQCRKIFPKGQKGIIYIYNASQIEGIPPVDNDSLNVNKADDELIDRIVKNMNVGYREIATNGANYNYSSDVITLPLKNDFKDEGSYFSTKLHELCHATGHKTVLIVNLKEMRKAMHLKSLEQILLLHFSWRILD